jgi:PPOX class probable F420-dependent enzyme
MTDLATELRAALTSVRLAHLVTMNPDGTPQVSVVWIGVDGDEIMVGHLGHGRKMANIERDPRVVLSVEAEGRTPIGLDHYVIVHGTARVTAGGAPELLQRLAHIYLGPDVSFHPSTIPHPATSSASTSTGSVASDRGPNRSRMNRDSAPCGHVSARSANASSSCCRAATRTSESGKASTSTVTVTVRVPA